MHSANDEVSKPWQDTTKICMQKKNPITLTNRNLAEARNILLSVTNLLESKNIPYHLEGGTLLGIVRDRDLLPWDNDLDISIPLEYAHEIKNLKFQFLCRGFKISVRKSKKHVGPITVGQYSVFKIKPLLSYIVHWFVPNPDKQFVVLDIFVKVKDESFTYWQAKEKVMRVENKFYESHDTVLFHGHELKAPNHHKAYLTSKYGDWTIPVKEWDCAKDEKTIVQ